MDGDNEAIKEISSKRLAAVAENYIIEKCILEMTQKGVSEEQDGTVVAIDSDKINALVS